MFRFAALQWLSAATEHGDKKSSGVLVLLHSGSRGSLKIESSEDLMAVRLKGEGGDPDAQKPAGHTLHNFKQPGVGVLLSPAIGTGVQFGVSKRPHLASESHRVVIIGKAVSEWKVAASRQRPHLWQPNLALCESSFEHAFGPKLASRASSRPATSAKLITPQTSPARTNLSIHHSE